eukprot:TRINITY_DN484_c0_g1_i4.p1 TRINITY_DN484_c0_g1~~TRINITY_DN484_c0_g1_i4.p1  ORF type:complete len:698 (-),score=120.79 TRINITY_DN484_c0_g1_i4:1833-3926(-)
MEESHAEVAGGQATVSSISDVKGARQGSHDSLFSERDEVKAGEGERDGKDRTEKGAGGAELEDNNSNDEAENTDETRCLTASADWEVKDNTSFMDFPGGSLLSSSGGHEAGNSPPQAHSPIASPNCQRNEKDTSLRAGGGDLTTASSGHVGVNQTLQTPQALTNSQALSTPKNVSDLPPPPPTLPSLPAPLPPQQQQQTPPIPSPTTTPAPTPTPTGTTTPAPTTTTTPAPARAKSQSKHIPSVEDGHLFIVFSSLSSMACDAWLAPAQNWLKGCRAQDHQVEMGWRWKGSEAARVTRLKNWPTHTVTVGSGATAIKKQAYSKPRPYLTNVSKSGGHVEWFMKGVYQFIDVAVKDLEVGCIHPSNRRVRHLLGIPLVGTRAGGANFIAGDICTAMIQVGFKALQKYPHVDIALVTNERINFAAIQAARSKFWDTSFAKLPRHLRASAGQVGKLAFREELVVFLGAGCSIGAGMMSWSALLWKLADEAKMSVADKKLLEKLSFLDRARIIQKRLGGSKQLKQSVADNLKANVHSMTHSLLAALPVKEFVTTNYDTLFETASNEISRKVTTIPYERMTDSKRGSGARCMKNKSKRYLLKLHGCVTHPDDIVLTRDDYLNFTDKRAALLGMVQAMLMTKHMLFVGFSLSDENFHSIASEVSKALFTEEDEGDSKGGGRNSSFGTSLQMVRNPLLDELWEG